MMEKSGLRLENLSLKKGGTSLSLNVPSGQSIAVVGAAGAGKTLLLRTIAGLVRPTLGSLNAEGTVHLADERLIPKRGRIDSLARQKGVRSASESTNALVAAGLWEARAVSITDASPGQLAAACLLPSLSLDFGVVLVDMLLDLLDVNTTERCLLELKRRRMQSGAVHLIATNDVSIVEQCDGVIVMKDCDFRASSSVDALLERTIPSELTVETTRAHAIRAMIEPFTIKASETPKGLHIEAFGGQEVAQRLLLQGYGDVKCVWIKKPSLAEILKQLI